MKYSIEQVLVVHDDTTSLGLSLATDKNSHSYLNGMTLMIFFSYRIAMASSCTQLCLQCRSLLRSKTVASTWQYSTQVRHCTTVIRLPTKVLNGSSVIRGNLTATQARQRWKQQVFCYSDLTAKHLATEAKEDKDVEESSGAHVVAYKSPLLPIRDAVPVTESQMSLGAYWFAVVDHKNFFIQR